ncbi:hypothetical protein LguiA_004901 [Lonicera macranthoides]
MADLQPIHCQFVARSRRDPQSPSPLLIFKLRFLYCQPELMIGWQVHLIHGIPIEIP